MGMNPRGARSQRAVSRLLSTLLPSAYRDQVVGDLHERGFRLADIAGTVPRVWWSNFRRSLNVPNMAGASEAVIRIRMQRVQRMQLLTAMLGAIMFSTGTLLDPRRGDWERAFAWFVPVAMLAVVLARSYYRPVPQSQSPVDRYRLLLKQMQNAAQLGSPYLFLVISAGRILGLFLSEPPRGSLIALGVIGAFVYGQFCGRRLQQEMESLA